MSKVDWKGSESLKKSATSKVVPDSKGCEVLKKSDTSKVFYEGWMVRYGRRKIGRSYIHMRYFVLETRLLAYYKRKPQDNMVPLKTLVIDGNCRVEDRGLKTHHGQMVYVLCIYNKKEQQQRMTRCFKTLTILE